MANGFTHMAVVALGFPRCPGCAEADSSASAPNARELRVLVPRCETLAHVLDLAAFPIEAIYAVGIHRVEAGPALIEV
jgi:hypothetical protein